ncbi:hypothetical protein BDF20DRAFT_837315 [Mycotypha africana]|uniref:uncharacterized protein n=1 Tax=Mycotypha africana TaxID=64632 RepID=UPI0022FFD605|nr:uncharacterized protein BDF20DRAFT_837315 [Mycotypha africana]KAI8973365.1 hypothetical protein BDF20DRAFT_837315 [Mycotypha africana]
MEELEARTKEIQSKIEQNSRLKEKAIELRQMLTDKNAQLQCDTQIRECQRYIDYFTEELYRLRTKSHRASMISMHSLQHLQKESSVQSDAPTSSTSATADNSDATASILAGSTVHSEDHTTLNQPLVTSPTQSLQSYFPKMTPQTSEDSDSRKQYTNLDLLEADTPINRAKVSLKLHELEYKVDVEKKVQEGIKNLYSILDSSSTSSAADRKRKQELHEKQLESAEKLTLLNNAVKKYKDLYLGEEEDDEDDVNILLDNTQKKEPASTSTSTTTTTTTTSESSKLERLEVRPVYRGLPGARRPVTGILQLKILEAHELAHAPTRMFRDPQTTVMVKIDGNIQYRTRPSRNDKWTDSFEMHVDKATEVELLIYDQSGDRTLPIGLLWLKISDIAENLRKQKLEYEQHGNNWVPAEEVAQQQASLDPQQQQQQSSNKALNASQSAENSNSNKRKQAVDEGISAWFDVEPLGRIYLKINFVRENVKRRPLDKLGRAGAVRERKGEIHEMNGHQFVARRFYHIMKCALCGDFMAKLSFQCEDCGLACHKKCYNRVVTRCKSRYGAHTDHDEDELKHHIPHRFESLTIIGANWCCHCGFMLPLGLKGAQKCAECNVVCHTKCAPLVPDFCGMTMEKANLMLSEMKAANKRRTFHSDSLPPFLPDNHQKPLFAFSSSSAANNTQLQSQKKDSHQPTTSIITPQPSTSTPVSTKVHSNASRSVTVARDQPSFQSLTSTFSQASINDALSRPNTKITTPVQVNRKVGLDDFNFLAVLGKGNFGKVMLAEEKYTNELYAIKILKKRFVLDNDEVESTRSEKRIFLIANEERHPFLVNLHSTFQTETRIYYVMEYVSGGDLMLQIQREQFSEVRARFYACEVLLALEYFHKHGIIYRDLKLDNIMLCLDGHIKLADYGLCKENMWGNNTTNTFCGTPEFMAPEILLEHRYGKAVDWWAFGVLIYEMLLGQSPFKGEDEDEIFDAILEDNILYPINMSKDSVSICESLLERNPEKRLGGGKGDAQEVKGHSFFAGVNWDDMLAKRVQPPFLPTVKGRADTSNFDEEFTREIPILTPVNAMLTPNEQQEFANFSYVANWAI